MVKMALLQMISLRNLQAGVTALLLGACGSNSHDGVSPQAALPVGVPALPKTGEDLFEDPPVVPHTGTTSAPGGSALGNGILIGESTHLSLKSQMTYYSGGYVGNVYMFGRYRGKQLYLPNIAVYSPQFWMVPYQSTTRIWCVAQGDLSYGGMLAQLTFYWAGSPDSQATRVAWTVVAYRSGDTFSNPTGVILAGSGPDGLGNPESISGQIDVEAP